MDAWHNQTRQCATAMDASATCTEDRQPLLTSATAAASVLFVVVVAKPVDWLELVVAVVLVVLLGTHAIPLGEASCVGPEPRDPVPATVSHGEPGERAEQNWMRLLPQSAIK